MTKPNRFSYRASSNAIIRALQVKFANSGKSMQDIIGHAYHQHDDKSSPLGRSTVWAILKQGSSSASVSTISAIADCLNLKVIFVPKGKKVSELQLVSADEELPDAGDREGAPSKEESQDLLPDDQHLEETSGALEGDPETTSSHPAPPSLRTKPNNSRFTQRLQSIQQEHNLGVVEFAKKLGLSASYASHILKGRRGVDINLVYQWTVTLNMDQQTARQFLIEALDYHLQPEALRILGLLDPPAE